MNDPWIASLSRQVRRKPGHAKLWIALGTGLDLAGHHDRAMAMFDRAISIDRHSPTPRIAHCFALAARGARFDALRELRDVAAAHPDTLETAFAVGVFCMRFGWPDIGVAQLTRARRMRPGLPYVAFALSTALELRGDHRAAEIEDAAARALLDTMCDAAGLSAEDRPTAPDEEAATELRSWRSYGVARAAVSRSRHAAMRGDIAGARQLLRSAHERLPGHPALLIAAARLHAREDDAETAAAWLRAAIAVEPEAPDALVELAFLRAEQGEIEASIEHLSRAVQLRPLSAEYRHYYGTSLLDLGEVDAAIEQFDHVLALAPDHGHATLRLAVAHSMQGRLDLARAVLTSSQCRQWPEARVLLAEFAIDQGDHGTARPLLEGVLAEIPEHLGALALVEQMDAGRGLEPQPSP